MNRLFLLLVLILCIQYVFTQHTILGFSPHYSYQFLGGDLGDKFTNHSNAGAQIFLKLKSNWTLGVEGQFMFGSDAKDLSTLGSLVTNGGFILTNNMTVTVPDIQGRGSNFFVEIGKVIPLDKRIPDCGIHAKFGVGMMDYKMLINVDDVDVSQLRGDYLLGYNRREKGMSYLFYLGYTFFSSNRYVNASFGIQSILFNSSYTNKIDYATNTSLEGKSFSSFIIGPKASFILILKKFNQGDGTKDGFFYN